MNDDGGRAVRRAEAALELRRPEEARRLLLPVIARDPADGWALALLAEASRQLGDDIGARALVRQAAASAPDDDAVLFLCGSVAQDLGDLEDARAWIERGLALDPTSAQGRNLLAITLMEAGDPDTARMHVTAALSGDPEDPTLMNTLGAAAATQGRSASAMVPWVRALGIAPDLPPLLVNVGLSRLDAGDLRRGSRLLTRAIVLDPRWVDITVVTVVGGLSVRRVLQGRLAIVLLAGMVAAAVSYWAGAVLALAGLAWLLRTYRLLPPPLRRGARGHLHPMDLVYVVLVVVGLLVPLVMLLTVLAWLGHVWLLRVLTYLELRSAGLALPR